MATQPKPGRPALTDRELLEVIRDFRAADWNAITLVHDELEIRIVKRSPGQPSHGSYDTDIGAPQRSESTPGAGMSPTSPPAASAPAAPAAPAQEARAVATPPAALPAGGDPRTSETRVVEAPTMGVFWKAPAPGAEPFVRLGDSVQAGQQLAIVEVMKLMTEVLAECDGTIEAVLTENGQTVEAGQALFYVRPVETAKGG